ncbi:FecCD family ABC transporter permease [Clostridium botulinum]|uniref:Iron ABC transporter permease n=1 Tax=Clostridium botulinum TaxID=1491 RepID=A0A9Q1UZY5_CLOBO|nr:iron ABC transporter permease [Clostridium botulinum]AEB75288.1 iron compound ABC transporter, permease protein [Clostridium botulinum BKT015925]KEI00873.1 iron ABC transporter permease [Clostridium botulinum C/D str. Sp77]KEI02275.1 iron ABC transporter permease [Clostridium botulinum D str. 16868]KLU75079.1 iron ABC transporter permease [Clostridium botulinum V891]KOA75052.1 iron ABC transporter permease [Clostridium botulinum]
MVNSMKNLSDRLKILIILLSLIILGFLVIVTIGIGSVSIPIKDIIDTFLGHGNEINESIIMDMRLPRIIIAVFVGASLSISGALLQSVMSNPLADPGITGVSSGASLVAIIVMIYFPGLHGVLPFMAFLGAIVACIMVFALSWDNGLSSMRIILAGVAVNAIFVGATSLLSVLNSDKIQGILLWINGSIAYKGWNDVIYLVPYSIIGIVLALFCAKGSNLLALGDDVATNLGVNVNKTRIFISLVAVFLAGISTSVVGIIGFIGLIVPHICRLILGYDYKYLIPMSATLGGILLLVADTMARFIARPVELPVGVIMSMIGGPFFLFLLRRRK